MATAGEIMFNSSSETPLESKVPKILTSPRDIGFVKHQGSLLLIEALGMWGRVGRDNVQAQQRGWEPPPEPKAGAETVKDISLFFFAGEVVVQNICIFI